jgi:aminopeptidase-like protein
MHRLISALYPICRSITGNGLRHSLHLLQRYVPVKLHEIPSGTDVFDWTVPKEWNIRDAYIKDSQENRVVDFGRSNLHVVNYSIPVKARVSLSELKEHLFTLPDHPGWIPYRTSYYKETWGFCLSHTQLQQLQEGTYEVCIDSTLENGHMTYGDVFVAGKRADEILISCHICHPSLCNDNLSGVAVAAFLARTLQEMDLNYSYRFLFIPGTIGSIAWLCLNEEQVSRVKHGLVLAGVGDAGNLTYKRSRRGNAEIDRAVAHVLKHSGSTFDIVDFSPYGYDERQYCSPGFDLPVGCLMRTPFGRYAEYHTSGDNEDFVLPTSLADSFAKCLSVIFVLENNFTYRNQNPKCEPRLGKRGLYRSSGGSRLSETSELPMLWVLNLSDGNHSLLEIAERADLPFEAVKAAADLLQEHSLLRIKSEPTLS